MWRKSSYSNGHSACVEVGMDWHTSSHSHGNGACVEVGWNKSSHSYPNSNCVETATGCGQVHVRDSKNPDGGVLTFSPGEWMAFLAGAKRDDALGSVR